MTALRTIRMTWLVVLFSSTPLLLSASLNRQPFLPGMVSTASSEVGGAFTPDGKSFYFSRFEGAWGSSESGRSTIYVTRLGTDGWEAPEPAAFSGEFDDSDVSINPDGSRLYFTSRRTYPGKSGDDNDIWMARRHGEAWSVPEPLPEGINSSAEEYSPVEASSGRLYFASARTGGIGQGDIYVAEPAANGEAYAAPENLGRPVNSEHGEWDVMVAPDESFLILEASGRPDNVTASGDLYVSRRASYGWGAPVNLRKINTEGSDLMASLMPGGESIVYSSTGGHAERADLYTASLADVMPQKAASSGLGGMLAVVSRSNHEVVLVSPSEWKVIDRIPVGRGPHEVVVDAEGGSVLVPNYGIYPEPHEDPITPSELNWLNGPKGTVSKVDLESEQRVDFNLSDCGRAHGAAVHPRERVFWVTCEERGTVQEYNLDTGERLRVFELDQQGAHIVVASNDAAMLFVSNVDSGSVSIIDLNSGDVATLPTGTGAEGLALSPDGRMLIVANSRERSFSVIDVAEKRVIQKVPSNGIFPNKGQFTPDGTEFWLANVFSSKISIFDTSDYSLKHEIEFESSLLGFLISPDGKLAFTTMPRLNQIAVHDVRTRERVAVIDGVMEADGMVWVDFDT